MPKFYFITTNYRIGPPTPYRGLCHVRSCGHYCTGKEFQDHLAEKNFLELYWCVSGNGVFEHNGKVSTLYPGEVCCYFPGEFHNIHAETDKWDYYWLTLDGPEIPELIRHFQLQKEPWKAGKCPVELFEKLLRSLSFSNVHGMHRASLYAYEILSLAANGAFQAPDTQVEQLIEEIENNFHQPNFSICTTAKKLGIHRSTLYRLFMANTGLSPQNYLVEYRLKEAMIRIIAGVPVKTVAFECGFADPNYFTRLFHKKYGMTPTEYRHKH